MLCLWPFIKVLKGLHGPATDIVYSLRYQCPALFRSVVSKACLALCSWTTARGRQSWKPACLRVPGLWCFRVRPKLLWGTTGAKKLYKGWSFVSEGYGLCVVECQEFRLWFRGLRCAHPFLTDLGSTKARGPKQAHDVLFKDQATVPTVDGQNPA